MENKIKLKENVCFGGDATASETLVLLSMDIYLLTAALLPTINR